MERKKNKYKLLSEQLENKGTEVSVVVVVGALGIVGEKTMKGLELIGFNEELRKKVAKKIVKEIATVNEELWDLGKNEKRINMEEMKGGGK